MQRFFSIPVAVETAGSKNGATAIAHNADVSQFKCRIFLDRIAEQPDPQTCVTKRNSTNRQNGPLCFRKIEVPFDASRKLIMFTVFNYSDHIHEALGLKGMTVFLLRTDAAGAEVLLCSRDPYQ